jgi:hypothetical protein
MANETRNQYGAAGPELVEGPALSAAEGVPEWLRRIREAEAAAKREADRIAAQTQGREAARTILTGLGMTLLVGGCWVVGFLIVLRACAGH